MVGYLEDQAGQSDLAGDNRQTRQTERPSQWTMYGAYQNQLVVKWRLWNPGRTVADGLGLC
jgi:hypothetical protein